MAHIHIPGQPHTHHHHSTPDEAASNIGFAFWLNLLFAVIELVGGIWTLSLAVISNALHDFGDAAGLGIGYILQKKSVQGPSEAFSYGLRRLSLLSAFLTGLVISVGAVIVFVEAVMSFSQPRAPHGVGMMWLAIVGIATNAVAAWKLGHGFTHNEKMMQWHLIEDVLGWVAVFLGSLGILFFKWNFLDPILALVISVFVLYNVVRRLADTMTLFLQGVPNPDGLRRFRDVIGQIESVDETHDVHFWSLDGVRHVLSLHVVLTNVERAMTVKEEIRRLSRTELGDCHLTIEIESQNEHCEDDCEHP